MMAFPLSLGSRSCVCHFGSYDVRPVELAMNPFPMAPATSRADTADTDWSTQLENILSRVAQDLSDGWRSRTLSRT